MRMKNRLLLGLVAPFSAMDHRLAVWKENSAFKFVRMKGNGQGKHAVDASWLREKWDSSAIGGYAAWQISCLKAPVHFIGHT